MSHIVAFVHKNFKKINVLFKYHQAKNPEDCLDSRQIPQTSHTYSVRPFPPPQV